MLDSEMIQVIIEWVDNEAPDDFDASFIESVNYFYKRHGYITEKQKIALENIIDAWRINDSYI